MSEPTQSGPPPTTSQGATAVGATTRSQTAATTAANREDDATERSTNNNNNGHNERKKEAEKFKGSIEKMAGHVFQMPQEARKANQFRSTLDKLKEYVSVEMEQGLDLRSLFDSPMTEPVLTEPPDEPPAIATDNDGNVTARAGRDHRKYIQWKASCKRYDTRINQKRRNMGKLFAVTLGQCSKAVTSKLKALDEFKEAEATSNCLWLLSNVQAICNRFEESTNRYLALVKAKKSVWNHKQKKGQSVTEYYEELKELIDVVESYNGIMHDPPEAAPDPQAVLLALDDEEQDGYMRDRTHAVLLIENADKTRFGKLQTDLANDFQQNHDKYPTDMVKAYNLLLGYTDPDKHAQGNANQQTDGNRGGGSRGGGRGGGRRGRGRGRHAQNFTQLGLSFIIMGLTFAQAHNGSGAWDAGPHATMVHDTFPNGIPDHYVLLDSESTVTIFKCDWLMDNITEVDETLYLIGNGDGEMSTNLMGNISGLGAAWLHEDSLANILSLKQVSTNRRVVYDSAEAAAFKVYRSDGTIMEFVEHPSGLYIHDLTGAYEFTQPTVVEYSCLQTVSENRKKFTRRELEAADATRKLHHIIGRPGSARFEAALKNNYLLNCPLTVADIRRAESMYGPDVGFLKGKTTAKAAPAHVAGFIPVEIPAEIMEHNCEVTLVCDVLYMLGLPYSLTYSRDFQYTSIRPLANRQASTIKSCLLQDIALYTGRNLSVVGLHCDGEYATLQHSFPGTHVDICAPNAHVPEAERSIRSTKETFRATAHGTPFSHLPCVMSHACMEVAQESANMFPHPDGVSSEHSPDTLITGRGKRDYRAFQLEYGAYIQVYDGTSNDTTSRTLGAIALYPVRNNSLKDYYFMSLATGARIHRGAWTPLPISDTVIARVKAIALEEGMPGLQRDHFITEYDPDAPVDESAYDQDYVPPAADDCRDHELTTDAYADTSDDDDDDFDDVGHHPDFDEAQVGTQGANTTTNDVTTAVPAVPATREHEPSAHAMDEPTAPTNTEATTATPEEGGATVTPEEGGAEASPQEGGAEATPEEGGAEASPKEGGAEATPEEGGAGASTREVEAVDTPEEGGAGASTQEAEANVTPEEGGKQHRANSRAARKL